MKVVKNRYIMIPNTNFSLLNDTSVTLALAGGSNASLENITEIDGQMILEIPVQNNPIPPSVLYEANSWGIIIRDVQGTIY